MATEMNHILSNQGKMSVHITYALVTKLGGQRAKCSGCRTLNPKLEFHFVSLFDWPIHLLGKLVGCTFNYYTLPGKKNRAGQF